MAGLLQVASNYQLDQAEQKRAAEQRQAEPVIVGLAAHLQRLWHPAWLAKKPIETKMLRALRQRNGEYEADKASEINKFGGSQVYMMITETKCRAAESWLKDILLDSGDIPFDIIPTPIPDMPPDVMQQIQQKFADKVMQTIDMVGQAPDPTMMEELKHVAEQDVRMAVLKAAGERCDRMQDKISDQFAEGGLVEGFDEFLGDLTTYPCAFLKGPTVRRIKRFEWQPQGQGQYTAAVIEDLAPRYKRVDPYRMYVEPGITRMNEGYVFEHHKLSRPELAELIGVPGYDDGAVRAVLDEMPHGNMSNWLWSAELQKSELEQKFNIWMRPTEIVDALEFWGKIPGKLLLEWGMGPDEIPDPAKEYDANVWMIGRWVIKATLNYDPLGRNPYYKTSYIKRPGAFWGSGIPEIIEDVQAVCNAAARSLVNNMGLASGPQIEMNVDRLPPGEKVEQIFPWKIWQVTNDPLGAGQPAVRFFQPDDRSGQLMEVYQHFAKLADDQSGIPAYVYGDMDVGGAGRTASGLSMLMGSAGKGIRQVVMNIDMDVIEPLVTAQFNWNMRYVDDPAIKGDAEIRARGSMVLANREQLNVRRVEFLQATANPIDSQIVGLPGRAAILRQVVKGLSMPVDDIVPSEEKMEEMQQLQQLQQQQQAAAQQGQAGPPGQPGQPTSMQFQHDQQGKMVGATVFPGGAPKGGQDSNQVANRNTGRAA